MIPVDLYICTTCQPEADKTARPGKVLHENMAALAKPEVRVHAVECLGVCKRPCTIAVSQPNKWTYIIGGIDAANTADICQYINAYAASDNGRPPIGERPDIVKNGVVARLPPLEKHYAS